MFTGLIQHLGRVERIETVPGPPGGASLLIDATGWDHQPQHGDSIAVNGCCLTVAVPSSEFRVPSEQTRNSALGTQSYLNFDVVHQTLRLTALGELAAGDAVNLEHAVTPATLLGGHIVQGHIDGVGVVAAVTRSDEHRLRIHPPRELLQYIIERGSIAIDGVSLTIASLDADAFEVALVPTTLEKTTLSRIEPGMRVNIETDYIAKIIARQVGAMRAR